VIGRGECESLGCVKKVKRAGKSKKSGLSMKKAPVEEQKSRKGNCIMGRGANCGKTGEKTAPGKKKKKLSKIIKKKKPVR